MEAVRVATEDDLDELVRLAGVARAELGAERGGPMWQLLHGRPDPLAATVTADLTEAAGVVHGFRGNDLPADSQPLAHHQCQQ